MTGAPRSEQSTPADQALALALSASFRTAGYFDSANDVMRETSASLAAHVVDRAEQEGSVQVGMHGHCVFVGAARIRSSLTTFARFSSLMQLFSDRGINLITFHAGVTDAELSKTTVVLARETGVGPDALNDALRRAGVRHVDVELAGPGTGVQAVAPMEAYAAAVHLGEMLREETLGARRIDMRRVRHITHAVVDQVLDDPRKLIALTTIKEMDDKLISHSANVAILSVLLGHRLGLGKSQLGELCLAGFLHDAGKLEVTPEVLGKPGPLSQNEWVEMRKHPLMAARSLLGGRRLTPAAMRAVVVAYEHHLNYDMSGYPVSQIKDHVSLFGNIVAVADRYDALTTARAYRSFSFTPHEVIGYLIYYAGTSLDPVLVKLFVEMMGLYPPGTLVRLTNGDMGVVCEPPPAGRPLHRPKVRVWSGTDTGHVVDLGEQPEDGTLDVAVVLSPGGMGQVPAVEMSVFNVERTPAPPVTMARSVPPPAPTRSGGPNGPAGPTQSGGPTATAGAGQEAEVPPATP